LREVGCHGANYKSRPNRWRDEVRPQRSGNSLLQVNADPGSSLSKTEAAPKEVTLASRLVEKTALLGIGETPTLPRSGRSSAKGRKRTSRPGRQADLPKVSSGWTAAIGFVHSPDMQKGPRRIARMIAAAAAIPLALATASGALAGPSVRLSTERAWVSAMKAKDPNASCREAIGVRPAKYLVRYCRYWSAATHPPCNSSNTCDLIAGHIAYSCNGKKPDPTELPCDALMDKSSWNNVTRFPAL
jgi:hypothetical protein